jgi:hypothetical protein
MRPSGVRVTRSQDSANDPATPADATVAAFISPGRSTPRSTSASPTSTTPWRMNAPKEVRAKARPSRPGRRLRCRLCQAEQPDGTADHERTLEGRESERHPVEPALKRMSGSPPLARTVPVRGISLPLSRRLVQGGRAPNLTAGAPARDECGSGSGCRRGWLPRADARRPVSAGSSRATTSRRWCRRRGSPRESATGQAFRAARIHPRPVF